MIKSVYKCPTCGKVFRFTNVVEKNERFEECCPECGDDEITEGYVCPICGRFHEGADGYCEKCKDYVQADLVKMLVETGTFMDASAAQMIDIVDLVITSRLSQTRAREGLQRMFDTRQDQLHGRSK